MSREKAKSLYEDRTWPGLEICPSYNPLFPKKEGYNVKVADRLDRSDLLRRYDGHGVDTSAIEDVDLVWENNDLNSIMKVDVDYRIIAVHRMLEHMPDPISFLKYCEKAMSKDGRLIIMIPDKRYCFDCLRSTTSLGQLIDAYHERRDKPSRGAVAEHHMMAVKRNGLIAWDNTEQAVYNYNMCHSVESVVGSINRYGEDEFDVHSWVFTPRVLHSIINDLNLLGYIRLNVLHMIPTLGHEFFAVLAKDVPARSRESFA